MYSADAYVHDMLRAAEAQSTSSKVSRRGFLKLTGLAGGGLVLAFYMGEQGTALANAKGKEFAPNAFLRITPDGVITLYSKAPEIGQGTHNLFSVVAAQTLAVSQDQIHVRAPDTAVSLPFAGVSAQRTTMQMGNAVHNACNKLKQELLTLAAQAKGGKADTRGKGLKTSAPRKAGGS